MINIGDFQDKELLLLRYICEIEEIADSFSVKDLLRRYLFLQYLIQSDEIEETFNSLAEKKIIVQETGTASYSYSLAKEITKQTRFSMLPRISNYILQTREDIINRIPLSVFQELDRLKERDSLISEFSQLLALGDWTWWKTVCEHSRNYNLTLRGDRPLEAYIAFIGKEFGMETPDISNLLGAKNSWQDADRGFAYFSASLSAITPWKNIEPVIFIIKAKGFNMEKRQKIFSIQERLRFTEKRTSFFIFVMGETNKDVESQLKTMTDIVTVFNGDIKKIVLAKFPPDSFRTFIKKHITLHLISPYQTRGHVEPSFFRGRSREINTIFAHNTKNFAIYGSRRIGKTSLLTKIVEILINSKMENTASLVNVIFLNCERGIKNEAILCKELAKQVGVDNPGELSELADNIYDINKGVTTIVIDEIDELLRNISVEEANAIMGKFRALADMGYLRIIVAGFMTLHRFFSDIRSPVYNFMDPIRLGFLDENDAIELVRLPMLALGVDYEKDYSTIKQLLHRTSMHPNLIQIMCDELVKLMDKNHERTITSEHITEVFHSNIFSEYVNNIFFINASRLSQLIILLNLLEKPFPEKIIYEKIRKQCPRIQLQKINQALEELVLSFILNKKGSMYSYFYSRFPEIMKRQHDIDILIEKLTEELNK